MSASGSSDIVENQAIPVSSNHESAINSDEIDESSNIAKNSENEIIEQLSLKLLQQSELTNNLQHRIATLNTQLNQTKTQLLQARREKHEADLEVTRLSTEVENITQELFEQANVQVAEANQDAYNVKQLNDRLAQTIKEKDTTIEILQAELASLKDIITSNEYPKTGLSDNLKKTSSSNVIPTSDAEQDIPESAHFKSKLLEQYNNQLIYTPLFNQIRFDLPPFMLFSDALMPRKNDASRLTYDLKSSKFYSKLLEELGDTLRLDKAPALQSLKMRWNKKIFLQDLVDRNVNIQPLSAATEVWKSQTLQKYIPMPVSPQGQNNEDSQLTRVATISQHESSYDPEMFSLATNTNLQEQSQAAPLALVTSCGLCGETRKDLNFSRLYHLRFDSLDDDKSKRDYPLCINCANKYRAVVELLKFVASLNPLDLPPHIDLDDYIRASWLKFVELKSKLWYTANIGIWSEKEMFGLVYGWQNLWLTSNKSKLEEGKEKKNNRVDDSSGEPSEIDSETTVLSKQKSRGWTGWSDIIAQSPNDSAIKVEIDVGTNNKTQTGIGETDKTMESKSTGSESADETPFTDAVDEINKEHKSVDDDR